MWHPACGGAAGNLRLEIDAGTAQAAIYGRDQVLRRIDHPIRDADWTTLELEETRADTASAFLIKRGEPA